MAKSVLIALIIIGIGFAWLLSRLNWIRGEDWIWTIFLGAAGILTLAWGKLNKLTFMIGIFLLISSLFTIINKFYPRFEQVQIPLLVIVSGLLFLFVQASSIPHSPIVVQMKEDAARKKNV